MIRRRGSHVWSFTPIFKIAFWGLILVAGCKEAKQEKVYPRGCYYPDECSLEDFQRTINENPGELDEATCGSNVLEESVTATEAQDLGVLSGITYLKGNLRIVQSSLTDLTGLESLLCISGNLEIAENLSLANLDGLSNLEQIGGFLKVGTNKLGDEEAGPNSALQNISGLGKLKHIGTHLWITKNPLITDIDALGQITTAQNVVITANAALTNIDGLSNLTEIRGYLKLGHKNESNASLQNVDGLANVTYIGGYAWIAYNDSLENLDGLASVEWIGDYLGIFGNSSLESVAGLHGLKALCGFLNIAENPKLPGCAAAQIPLETEYNCGVCIRLNQSDSCEEQVNGCLYDRCVQEDRCDGGTE